MPITRTASGLLAFNPFTAAISSRGSGEALVTVMLLLILLQLFKGAPLPPCDAPTSNAVWCTAGNGGLRWKPTPC